MKASPRQQQLLLELQELDTQQLRLKRRLAQLPEHEELAKLAKTHAEARERFMNSNSALEELQTDISRLESELETVKQRHTRTTERLAGSVQAKEAVSLQDELDALERRRLVLEDRELEVMQEAEDAEREFAEAREALAEVEADIEQARASLTEAEQHTEAELVRIADERAGLAAEVQGPVLEVYERTRERYGIGAARLRGRVSEGSNMELDSADYQAAMSTPADELYFCPTSGAILVREPAE